MRIDNRTFEVQLPAAFSWEEQAFIFCQFHGIEAEGAHITSDFIDSRFERCDLYLSLFNTATLVGVKLKNCDFRGCSFLGCRFVECTFENCRFVADNLGGECVFDDSRWYGCKQFGSHGLSVDHAAEC